MNQAALHASEALARYEAQQLLDHPEEGTERLQVALHSGRNISSQPYGKDSSIMEKPMSQALVRIKQNVDHENDDEILYDGHSSDQVALHPSNSRAPLPYPASSILCAPGIDAAGQLATLQAKLNQRLGPEYISTRQGPGGGKLSYIEGWKAIDLANEVFGFNGWSSSITRMDVDFMDELEGKRWNVGVSIVMRITLRDGTFHEDVGYGHCENVKMKHMALEKARKEASTDSLKRALRTFGRMLGNCLYDKKFIDTASKMKAAVPSYDLTELKRTSAAQPQAPSVSMPADLPARVVQRGPSVQQRQSLKEPLQQHQKAKVSPIVAPGHTVRAMTESASAQVNDQASPAPPISQTKEERLREQRKAMAAAKQAELRARKIKEQVAQQGVSKVTMVQKATNSSPQASAGKGQGPAAAASNQMHKSSFDGDDVENVDDYDLALMEAGLSDGAEFVEEEIVKASRDNAAKPLLISSMDDSGIGMVEERNSRQQLRLPQRISLKTTSPNTVAKGRFIDSSPTTRNDSGKLPSSSPKMQIPIKAVRRLSWVADAPNKVFNVNNIRSSQEQQPSISLSQRNRGNRSTTTMQPPVNNNYNRNAIPVQKRTGPNQYNEVQVKRSRPSP